MIIKGDLNPVMLKEIFHDSFENFEITRIWKQKKRQLFESMMFFVAKVGERHHAKN